jgi:AAA+ ATPase superfamily predicted ATPase
MAVITPAGFVGRRDELAALERHYKATRSGLLPVYGRRRVGKTELLLQFSAKKPTVYFTASDKLRTPQIIDFVRAAAEWLGAPHLAEAAPATWEAAL